MNIHEIPQYPNLNMYCKNVYRVTGNNEATSIPLKEECSQSSYIYYFCGTYKLSQGSIFTQWNQIQILS